MKMKQMIVAMIAVMTITAGFAGDSKPFLLDTREERAVESSIVLPYDAAWIGGNSGAMVVIEDNGTIVTNTTGAGEFTHTLTSDGRHELTYTTYIGGVAQDEVYKTVVYKGKYIVHFESNGGEGAMEDCGFGIDMPSVLPPNTFTRVGYTFAGWATVAEGEVEYCDKALVTNLTETADATASLYAVWSPNQYQIKFNANGGGGWMENQTLTYDAAASLTSNSFTKVGYTFVGWATAPNGEKVYDDDAEVLNLATDENAVIDLYALWRANAYTVIFDANGGEGEMESQPFTYDTAQTLTANIFTHENRFFAGWATEPGGPVGYVDAAEVMNVTADDGAELTFYAVWADNRIDFDANGGEGEMEPFFVFSGTEQTLPRGKFTKEGYFLLGWALTQDGEATLLDGDSTADIVAEEGDTVTLYAVWHEGNVATGGECTTDGNANWYVQTSDTHDGIAAVRSGAISDNQSTWLETTISGSGTLSFWWEVSSEGGYDHLRFYIDGNEKDCINGDRSWEQKFYGIPGDGEHILRWTYSKDGSVNNGSDCGWVGEITWPTSDNVHRWVVDSNPPQLDSFYFVSYAVRFDANGGEGTMPKRVYAIGDDVAFPDGVFARDGWTLVGWATEPEGSVIYPAEGIIDGGVEAANRQTVTLYARWAQNQYTVHFDANGGDGEMVDESFWIGIPDWLSSNAFTRVGYTFAGWATVAEGEVEYCDKALVTNLTETADMTVNLYAVWSPNQYQVRFNANGGEGGWSEKMDYGTMIVAPEVSRIGYTFKGWDKDVAATVPDEDITYTAQWEVNAYAVTFDGNGGEGGTSCEQDYNSPIVAPSVSRIGHTFAGWLPEVAEIVPASNVTYTAQWEVNQYSVTFDANGGVGGLSAMQNYDSEIVPPVVSRVGCTFEGWLPSPDAKVPNHDVEYVAQWKVWDITVDSAASSVKELYPDDYFRITNIVIGAEVECLPAGFFDGCDALESLAFLSSETELGDNDLRTVGRLFECQPDGYWVVQGVLFGYKGDCPREIPELDSVKRVVDCALDGCKALEELNFTAESVLTTIGTNAFKHCTELQRMTLPPSLEEIGDEAFMGCSYLGNVIVPGNVKRVGDRAFKNCTGFTAAQIEYGVESLGEEVFYGDWRISEVDIPSTVTNIGVNAFGGDSSIIRIGLRGDIRPASDIFSNYENIREATVKAGDGEIVNALFSGFKDLRSVHFLGNCPRLENDGEWIYYGTPVNSGNESGLITYVEADSTGWDGTPGSHSLPQAWPLVGGYRRSIAVWDAPTYLCQFDSNGGTLGIQDTYQYSEKRFVLPPEPVQTGYSFAGWWTQPVGGLRVTADTIFIEGVYTHLYAHWIKGHWVFLDPNGGTVVNDFVTYVEQSVYGVLPTPVRSGYAFGGWFYDDKRIEPETEINEKADHTLVAQWTANLYSVRYNANGGDGDMAEQGFVYGVEQELRKNLYARSGYEFIGWATNAVDAVGLEEETDAVVYADCESVANLTAVADGWIELYAVWRESNVLPDPSNLDFHSSGDSNWELRYEGATVEKDGKTLRYATVWRSGNIGNNQKSVLVANTYGAGKIGFWWKVSCESFKSWKLDYLEFAIDGTAQEPWINGEKDWTYVEFEVESSGEHTLTWTYSKDEEGVGGEDCGWITAAVWTPKLESFGDYVNSPTLEFASSGNAEWHGDENTSHDGIASLRSGAIGDDEVSTLEAEVDGAGRIGFWWKVSSEAYRTFKLDYVSFWIDDVEQDWIGGEIGWTNVAFDVVGSGTHILKWEYRKDAQDSSGDDCAWLDEVVWTPKSAAPVVNIDKDKMEEPEIDEESGTRTIAMKGDPLEDEAEIAALVEQVTVSVMVGAEQVYTTAGYNKTYDPTSNTIVITLKEPEVGAEEVAKVEDDATGVLADMSDEKVELATTEPEPTAEETAAGNTEAGALPVKTVKGLYYQASWGSDLSNMRQGEKVQATGETIYLGVIKQQGIQGFYKVTVSEQ